MTYSQAIEFLYSLRWFGAKFGLENTRRLAEFSGNPQDQLRFIHVAGTNGKGSTCAMLESIYRKAGLRVGLFTSPHLVHFSERIQVNRRCIGEKDVARLVDDLLPLLATFEKDHHPTFFEVVTIMALRFFHEQQCDLVIWETGLGGRLDATNIVHPLASVITNIQYDHEKWLGNTLASIAAEKAGIIKPGVPVITGVATPEPLQVIREAARNAGSPLFCTRPAGFEQACPGLQLPLPGAHQHANAAVALETVKVLQTVLPVKQSAIRDGLEQVYWPARLQRIERANGQVVLLDAAHNPSGAETLAEALKIQFADSKICLILGILQDKDYGAMCRLLAPLAQRVLIAPVHSERAAPTSELADVCTKAKPGLQVAECASLAEALRSTTAQELVVIAGSLYLVGEAMELLGISPSGKPGERLLNEWQPKGKKA